MDTAASGLSSREAALRLRASASDALSAAHRAPGIRAFFARLGNPLILILLFAAGVSGFFGDIISASIIVGIVFVSAVLDFANSYRSERAVQLLISRIRITATVRRDGKPKEVPFAEIVPGDVVELSAGDLVPADGSVLEAKDFFMNESSLTGESFPREAVLKDACYLGASVITGTAAMLVERTGKKTKYGAITAALETRSAPTEFDRGIKDFSILVMRATLSLVIVIFVVNALVRHELLQSLLFAAALAVGLTPELLPMIVTLNLTKGSLAMAKRGVIVKRLSAIQNFGSIDILATDKTGTLTEDRITLVRTVDAAGKDDDEVFRLAYLTTLFHSRLETPLDAAIRAHGKPDVAGYRKMDEIPFDYERKRDSVVVAKGDGRMLIAKGAPEELLHDCAYLGTVHTRLTDALRAKASEEYEKLSADGFRVLAVASQAVPEKERYEKTDESELVFAGFAAFLDPAKKTAKATLARMRAHGITVKILTGDNAAVTQKIAADIGLEVAGVLHGSDIEHLSREALAHAVETHTVFARLLPDQKRRIIEALRANGHVVGYLGDGVNDAPSLTAADVGISVENAVDVAREAADLILLRKSLADLVEGVIEGRRTFANTLKYLLMSLSSNFGNMFSMAGASLVLPFLPMQSTQILLGNLLYDTSQTAIPLDTVDPADTLRPRKISTAFLRRFMIYFGLLSSVFDFATFFLLVLAFHLSGSGFQTGWFLESIATQTFVVYIIRTRTVPFFGSRPASVLVASTLGVVVLAWGIVWSPFAHLFSFIPLSGGIAAAMLCITVLYLASVEFAKRFFYARWSADAA
ncbi:MAG: magnesium-translocating P-type ATPase [Patescibacteria group bacterium]|nr:magnesium-translocating P-type ATPase [Patescibacteria group bacterium]MDE1965769.1 magnesium-translocating P-type ATPase [Patescibacteria group bacterium]